MDNENLAERFKAGFTFGEGMATDEVLLDEKRTKGHVLAFLVYDANMWPAPDLSTWSSKGRQKLIRLISQKVKDVNAEVWVDDVKVKDYKEAKE